MSKTSAKGDPVGALHAFHRKSAGLERIHQALLIGADSRGRQSVGDTNHNFDSRVGTLNHKSQLAQAPRINFSDPPRHRRTGIWTECTPSQARAAQGGLRRRQSSTACAGVLRRVPACSAAPPAATSNYFIW
ncbi:MAG: hypothetical protein HRU17_01190 [Polyangiaceae bacterium]|nr:hypothetical protein [Polyangiaceae bacterium]